MSELPVHPLGHHELFLLLAQLSVLLLVGRGLGEVLRRLGQPMVVGELMAGVVLGPSLLGWICPRAETALFPESQVQSDLLAAVTWLGVLFLLVVIGLETDLNLMLSKGRTALLVSLGGISVTFTSGFCLGNLLPGRFLAHPGDRLVFSLFLATAMSITAVPVIAKVLMDMKLLRRDIGQITLASGMIDDTVGWVLLSFVAAFASGGFSARAPVLAVGGAILFMVIAFTLGRIVVARLYQFVDDHIGGIPISLSTLLILSLLGGALTLAMGIEPVLGAFVMGILSGQAPRFAREAGESIETVTAAFFAPVFFAAAGLKVDLLQLTSWPALMTGLIVLAVASLAKLAGVYAGARCGGMSHWEGIALGSAMNARGAIGLIIATIGLKLGVLNNEMYSIIVLVAIATTLMAPALLRYALRHVVVGDTEAARLQKEELARLSFVGSLNRILLPTRGGQNSHLAAQLIGHLSHQLNLEVTTMYAAGASTEESEAIAALDAVKQMLIVPDDTRVSRRISRGGDVALEIMKEASRRYQLLVLGATESPSVGPGSLFNSLVDRLVAEAPCATMVVRSRADAVAHPLRHILVPVIGTQYSRHAVELASAISVHAAALVTIVYVVITTAEDSYDAETLLHFTDLAQEIVDGQADLGRALGAQIDTNVLFGRTAVDAILEFIARKPTELMMVGSNIRPVSGRVFFGRRVEALLARASCPVAVVSSR